MTVVERRRFDTPPDARVAEIAARQHGRIRFDQLVACGLDDPAIRRRVRKGHLHRVHTGVYAVGHAAATFHAQVMAAVLAGGEGAVASHWTAASLHGFVRWDDRRIDVTVPRTGGRRRPGIRFHRARSLDPRDVTRHHGISVTTAARALLEIAPQLSDRRLKRAARQAQAERAASVRQIADVLRRANGHATGRLAAVIASGPAPTYSGHEDVVLDLILEAGIEHPEVNEPLVVDSTPYRPDMRWPDQRLVLEIDSAWHDGRLAQQDDAARQADLEAAGERVLRTTLEQAILHPRQLLRRLAAAGAPYTDRQPMISTNQLKNGNHIEVDGTIFKVLEFQHVKPGKGGAFVRTKLRRASDGNVIDRTFRAGEKFRAVHTEARKMQYLYSDGTDAHFMDAETYEQIAVPESSVAGALRWTKANDSVDVLFIDGDPGDLQLPSSVELEVTETEPGLRGDTASGGGDKPATLETGATVRVPLFVNIGDRIKVQTATGDYMSRA